MAQRARLSASSQRQLMYGVIKEGPPEPKEYQLMAFHICTACGTQYAESPQPPAHCVICEEERQYIPPRGQTWTTLDALQKDHTNTFHEYEKGIIGIGSTPAFSIGQRALLVPPKTAISCGTASPHSMTRL